MGRREPFLFPVINLVDPTLIKEGAIDKRIPECDADRNHQRRAAVGGRRSTILSRPVSIETITRAALDDTKRNVSNKLPLTCRAATTSDVGARGGLRLSVIIVITAIKRRVASTVNYYGRAQFPGMFPLFVA